MPTFKVQGQVYHNIGSIYSIEKKQEKFLQVCFIKDLDLQTHTLCNNIHELDRDLITELQFMFHPNNIFIQKFQSTIESIPRDYVDLKIIIRSDKNENEIANLMVQ
jgi:hypothetical protein